MASKLTQLAQGKSASQLQTMSRQSFEWLGKKISSLRRPELIPATIGKEKFRQLNQYGLGGLYFFSYDPKEKRTLPYYDTFPLVLLLEKYDDGFLGLNFHYLPLGYRLAFMEKLLPYATMTEDNDIRKVRVTYDILSASKRFREFKPCIKRYLHSNIRSRILMVQPNEWDVALFLPIQQFKKARPKEVWQDSIKEIRDAGQY